MSNNSFKVKNGLTLSPIDLAVNPPLNPQAGDLICDSSDSNKIKRYDSNASSWVEVGSGGVGGVDIFFVQDFESASLSSFTQTGLSLSQTDPLKGKVSALLTHDSSVDQLFKQVIPVDRKFRGQTMVLRLDSKSSASQGNVVINIKDETNSANLVASEQLQLSNDVNGKRTSVSFTIPETCASLSYTITALPESGSPTTRIDDIICELAETALLETAVVVPVVTAWQGYTPTFQGFGSPSAIEFEWRQVGENVEIRGKFVSGTSTAVEARVGLPAGLTSAGTSLIPSLQIVGIAGRSANASQSIYNVNIEPSVSYVTFGFQGSSNSAISKVNATVLVGTGESLSFFASVPCSGLSATTTKTIPLTQSGLVQEGDGNLQINGFTPARATTNTAIISIVSGTTTKNIGDHVVWTPSTTIGDTFTVTKSGMYSFSFSADMGTASDVGFSKNSTQLSTTFNSINNSDKLIASYDSGATGISTMSWTGLLVAGDIIRIHITNAAFSGASALYSTFSCSYQGSLKQVSINPNSKITIPTSELRFEGANARGTGSESGIVQFTSMAKIRGDAFTVNNNNGTAITITKSGMLSVSANVYVAPTVYTYITKNQAIRTANPTASETLASNGGGSNPISAPSWTGFVKTGDIIRVYSTANPTSDSSNMLNLSFQEQDISVSVTNTLPQFSESDSSVRVDTANGYGSTANKIRRFSNVRDSLGSDIQYNPNSDEATNGASFKVMSSGIYNISYTEQASGASYFGVSKNSSQLTTAIVSINTADRLCVGTVDSISGYPETVSWQGYLIAGDIIRPHTEGTAASAAPDRTQFTISKVGKPNVTGVDVTPFVNVPQPESQYAQLDGSTNFGGGGTVSGVLTSTNGSGIFSYNSTTGIYTILKNCTINASFTLRASTTTAVIPAIRKNSVTIMGVSQSGTVASNWITTSTNLQLLAGNTLDFYNAGPGANSNYLISITATALSDQILTAPETFSTDTASLTYAGSASYTLSTLQNAPVGTFITFTYAANTNTRTQTTTAPTQTTADMNTNGILLYARAFNATSSAAQPAAIAIQIGKGLKGKSLDLYKSAGKVTAGSLDKYNNVNSFASSNMLSFGAVSSYNELTGILLVDAGYQLTNVVTAYFDFSDITSQTSGYLVINASKNPALTGLGLKTVALRAVSSAGTAVGTVATTIPFSTVTQDTHGSYNTSTGIFTVPETGTYRVSSIIQKNNTAYSTAQSTSLLLYKNSTLYSVLGTTYGNASAIPFVISGTDEVFCAKGDTLYIAAFSSVASANTTDSTQNRITISKVGV